MKMRFIFLLAVTLVACDRILGPVAQERGTLTVCFGDGVTTRAGAVLDTNQFILSITDEKGGSIYHGKYGASPERLDLPPGSYTVRAVSREFQEPLFDSPQYGDEQVALVESGKTVAVHLICVQMNAGVRLKTGETFIVNYPDGTLYLKSSSGVLMYDYGESRYGYFKPGLVWLELNYGGETRTLFTREIFGQEMLTMRLNSGYSVLEEDEVASLYGEGLTMELDTSRFWTTGDYTGEDSGSAGGGISSALSVGQARSIAADSPEDVWVYGYIAGGDCTSSNCSFSAPFTSNTNLLIAAKSSSADKESCLSVQLQKGDIRDALNLVDHPENLGRQVFLKGDLVPKYYGIPGIKNITEYQLR